VDNDRLKSCDTGLQSRGAPNFKNHAGNASIPVAVGRRRRYQRSNLQPPTVD